MDWIEQKDSKLIAKENSYARVYTFSRLLLALTIVATFAIMFTEQDLGTRGYGTAFIAGAVWLAIFQYTKAKLEHIESIKHYRKSNESNNSL